MHPNNKDQSPGLTIYEIMINNNNVSGWRKHYPKFFFASQITSITNSQKVFQMLLNISLSRNSPE